MWPFRRKKPQPQLVEVARGKHVRVFFSSPPGIRFPLEEKERVKVDYLGRAGDATLTVKFTPADDVVYDLVRSSESVQVWWDDGLIVQLPITHVAWSSERVVVTAHERRRA